MRPMWLEFPQNDAMFNITSQFMFGDSFLFAPKLANDTQEVDVFLPNDTNWYEFSNSTLVIHPKEEPEKSLLSKIKDKFTQFTGKETEHPVLEKTSTDWFDHIHRNLTDLDLGLYIRGGSIVPVLNHTRQLSLLRAIDDPISLHVFLDSTSSASGKLVLDDGLTTKDDKLVIDYSYKQVGSTGVFR